MKVLLLAGGRGSRINEETELRPKPMVEIGGKPIIWHIMKMYSHYGFNEFIVLLGYKGYLIKEYFKNYLLHQTSVTIDLRSNTIKYHGENCEPWSITLIDSGIETMTGGRIKRAMPYINGDSFLLTYGDGLSNVNIHDLIKFHNNHGKALTMTMVQPQGRYGAIGIKDDNSVSSFHEKPVGEGAWVNGGFFVCDNKVFEYINDDSNMFENEPMERLVNDEEVYGYHHNGFWQCMDTMRDKEILTELWDAEAPWKIWNDDDR